VGPRRAGSHPKTQHSPTATQKHSIPPQPGTWLLALVGGGWVAVGAAAHPAGAARARAGIIGQGPAYLWPCDLSPSARGSSSLAVNVTPVYQKNWRYRCAKGSQEVGIGRKHPEEEVGPWVAHRDHHNRKQSLLRRGGGRGIPGVSYNVKRVKIRPLKRFLCPSFPFLLFHIRPLVKI
jgi:hypothetical protein